ncbi:MAG: hypothetical protein ACE15B_12910 [Bryobacteraceae bacterium]
MSSARAGTLTVLACHCVWDPSRDTIYTDRPEFARDRPVYEAQIFYARRHLGFRSELDPLLVISGGPTRAERACSESRSCLEWAGRLGIAFPAERVALEEYALTSIENVLLGLYVYHQRRGVWPERIDAISWEFKRARFRQALAAIGGWEPLGQSWPALEYFPVGDLPAGERAEAMRAEQSYLDSLEQGLAAYYADPRTAAAIARRDVHGSRAGARERYRGYPLPF